MKHPESDGDWFFTQETDWMIYLLCVVRGQFDPVFSFKDEHKSAKEHAYTEMQFQWALYSIAQ